MENIVFLPVHGNEHLIPEGDVLLIVKNDIGTNYFVGYAIINHLGNLNFCIRLPTISFYANPEKNIGFDIWHICDEDKMNIVTHFCDIGLSELKGK